MADDGDLVLSERRGTVAVLTLNRPGRMNAMTPNLVARLHERLSDAMNDDEIRAIVLTGQGERAFCAGDDLTEEVGRQATVDVRSELDRLQDVSRLILFGPKPVIAAVNGWAVGGGFEWVVNCDLSVWSENAIAFLPELDWGLFTTGAITVLLPRAIGTARANDLLYTGRRLSASEAFTIGLARQVVPLEDVRNVAIDLAASIATKPESVVSAMKRCLAGPVRAAIEKALADEADVLQRAGADPETAERLAKFAERTTQNNDEGR